MAPADLMLLKDSLIIRLNVLRRESDPEKLRELCRKALRDCQEQKVANWDLETKAMRLEREKEALGAPSSIHCPATAGVRLHSDAADTACRAVLEAGWP